MHKFEIYDFDDFFNIYPLEIAPIPIDRHLYIERTENDYYRKKVIGILKNFVKMKVIEVEETVKRIEESQSPEWKRKVEIWNKKFQQMGIKIKNNVDKEENKIIKNKDDKLKAIIYQQLLSELMIIIMKNEQPVLVQEPPKKEIFIMD